MRAWIARWHALDGAQQRKLSEYAQLLVANSTCTLNMSHCFA